MEATETPVTFEIADGYDKPRKTIPPRLLTVRPMTLDEIKALGYGDHPYIVCNDGKARVVKVNGAVQRWKTRPNEVSVPVKYGLRECARFDTTESLRRFIVVISA